MAGYTSVFAKRVADNCGGLTGETDGGNPVAFDPITIATLITTILPMITQWFQACREKRQQRQQDQTPQQQIAAAHADPVQRAKNHRLEREHWAAGAPPVMARKFAAQAVVGQR